MQLLSIVQCLSLLSLAELVGGRRGGGGGRSRGSSFRSSGSGTRLRSSGSYYRSGRNGNRISYSSFAVGAAVGYVGGRSLRYRRYGHSSSYSSDTGVEACSAFVNASDLSLEDLDDIPQTISNDSMTVEVFWKCAPWKNCPSDKKADEEPGTCGRIAGMAIALIAMVIIGLLILLFCLVRRHKRRKKLDQFYRNQVKLNQGQQPNLYGAPSYPVSVPPPNIYGVANPIATPAPVQPAPPYQVQPTGQSMPMQTYPTNGAASGLPSSNTTTTNYQSDTPVGAGVGGTYPSMPNYAQQNPYAPASTAVQ